jgi:hypothetical protein
MGFSVEWMYKPRLILVQYYGKVVADDIRGQADALHVLLDADGERPVHMVIDLSRVEGIGFGLGDLKNLAIDTHPLVGWMALATPNAMFRFLASVGVQFSRGKHRILATREEALKFLLEKDVTLHQLVGYGDNKKEE